MFSTSRTRTAASPVAFDPRRIDQKHTDSATSIAAYALRMPLTHIALFPDRRIIYALTPAPGPPGAPGVAGCLGSSKARSQAEAVAETSSP